MKVICVNADGKLPSDIHCKEGDFRLVEGEIYTVFDSFIEDGYCWYCLEEDKDAIDKEGMMWGFDSERFVNAAKSESAIAETNRIIVLQPKKKSLFQRLFS